MNTLTLTRSIATVFAGLLATAAVASADATHLVVRDGWARPAHGIGVAYVTIVNDGNRAVHLTGATTPVADRVELHTSYAVDAPAMNSRSNASGMGTMRNGDGMDAMHMTGEAMKPLASLTVPAHTALTLSPGANHLMLTGLKHDLRLHDRFALKLRFSDAAPADIFVTVDQR